MSKTVAAATISTPVRFYEWRSLNCSYTQAYTNCERRLCLHESASRCVYVLSAF